MGYCFQKLFGCFFFSYLCCFNKEPDLLVNLALTFWGCKKNGTKWEAKTIVFIPGWYLLWFSSCCCCCVLTCCRGRGFPLDREQRHGKSLWHNRGPPPPIQWAGTICNKFDAIPGCNLWSEHIVAYCNDSIVHMYIAIARSYIFWTSLITCVTGCMITCITAHIISFTTSYMFIGILSKFSRHTV